MVQDNQVIGSWIKLVVFAGKTPQTNITRQTVVNMLDSSTIAYRFDGFPEVRGWAETMSDKDWAEVVAAVTGEGK